MSGLKTLDKAMSVLWALVHAGRPAGSLELATQLHMEKTAVHRILKSFERTGLVRAEERGRYQIYTETFYAIINAASLSTDVQIQAHPILERLALETSETSVLTLLTGDGAMCVDKVDSSAAVRVTYQVGRRTPLYAGASTRVILAYLPAAELARYLRTLELAPITEATITQRDKLESDCAAIRKRGYCFTVGEVDSGVAAISAPILREQRVIGSISIAGFAPRFQPGAVADKAHTVKAAAARLSARLQER